METVHQSVTRATALVCVVGAFAPTFVHAYKTNTHQGITKATIESYESARGDAFTIEEEQVMIKGSLDEDESTRPLQHFYDPVNNRGLTVIKSWEASKYWAEDTVAQANYCAWGICFKTIGFYDKYFSSPTDFSWERAVYEYAHGDKTRAAETLGHILHLVQDSTVPAHVRNDQHLNHEGFGDMDPYEEYTGTFGTGNISKESISVASKSGLPTIFDETAGYANNNFLSKDTFFDRFSLPKQSDSVVNGKFAYSNSTGRKIAFVTSDFDWQQKQIVQQWFIDNENHDVAADNWQALSHKAIESGASIIDLFFREVAKEKQTLALQEKNKSEFEKQPTKLALGGFGLVKSLYGSSLEQGDVAELLGEGQAAAVAAQSSLEAGRALAASEPETPVDAAGGESPTAAAAPEDVPESISDAPAEPKIAPKTALLTPTVVNTALEKTAPPPGISLPAPTSPQGFSAGDGAWGGGGGHASQEVVSTPQAAPAAPAVVLPQDPVVATPLEGASFATTSITASGMSDPNNTITLSYTGGIATTSADASGSWSFALDLPENSYTFSFTASDGTNNSNTITRNVTIDLTAPASPAISSTQCTRSLSASFCLIAGNTVHISWAAIADATRYEIFANSTSAGDTTGTSFSVSLAANATNTMHVIAYDAAGNNTQSNTLTIRTITQPIIINEIAWSGTSASASDEWIEIKNISSYNIDMSNVALVRASSALTLSGTLNAMTSANNSDLYLIERRAQATTADHQLETLFDQLDDMGEQFTLAHAYGTGTTTIDETPEIATCAGWCAGSLAVAFRTSVGSATTTFAKLSMERIATTTGTLASSWRSNDGYTVANGSDASAGTVYGTPAKENSEGLPEAGWYCGSGSMSITANQTYTPSTTGCYYFSRFIGATSDRYGGLYKGTLGNATEVATHAMGKSSKSNQAGHITAGSAIGQQFFVAIWEIRISPVVNDVSDFHAYFQHGTTTTGASIPPHNNYRVIPWVYGP